MRFSTEGNEIIEGNAMAEIKTDRLILRQFLEGPDKATKEFREKEV